MAKRDILAIGASAGGVEALAFLAKNLPRDFPAAVIVTLHPGRHPAPVLDVLSRAGPLPALFASGQDILRRSCILIAPPDRHMIVEGDVVTLGNGPRENNTRPAAQQERRREAAK